MKIIYIYINQEALNNSFMKNNNNDVHQIVFNKNIKFYDKKFENNINKNYFEKSFIDYENDNNKELANNKQSYENKYNNKNELTNNKQSYEYELNVVCCGANFLDLSNRQNKKLTLK